MTNSTDFRRYSFANDASYAVEAFDVKRSPQAPLQKPKKQRELKVHKNPEVKSFKELQHEQRIAIKRVIEIVVAAIICFVMVCFMIYSFAQKNELTRQISTSQVNLENAKSENISLQSEIDSLVSMSMIDQYAVEKLGMTKVKSNQICYTDVNQFKADRNNTQNQPDDSNKK